MIDLEKAREIAAFMIVHNCYGGERFADTLAEVERLRADLRNCSAYVGIGPGEGDLPIPERVRRTVNRLNGSVHRYEQKILAKEVQIRSLKIEETNLYRQIEQLEAEIERLRGFETATRDLNNDLIRIAGERDELAARIQELEALRSDILEAMRRPKTTSSDGLILYLKELDEYNIRTTKRVGELEDALVEYQRLGKTVSEAVVPCLTAHGNCYQCRPKAKAACDAIETIRKGKIGPDAALKKQWDDVLGTKPRSWQITDERKAAIQHILMCHHCRVDDSGCKASVVLRGMLQEVGQE